MFKNLLNLLCFFIKTSLIMIRLDMDRASKHGLGDIVTANPYDFNQHEMFTVLQNLTVKFRLSDPYTSLVSHSILLCYTIKH